MKGGQTMRKAFLSVIGTLLGMLGVFADNISITDVNIERGNIFKVDVNLNNTENNLVSFQMDLTLPTGVTVVKDKCSLSSRISDSDQELTVGKQGENTFRLTSTSYSLKPIKGTSGSIITLWLKASETASSGNATISNIRFGTSNSERINMNDVEFKVNVIAPSPVISFADATVKSICVKTWDTNDDGELSEAEAAVVKELGAVFKGNTSIQSFNELRYFTGFTSIGNDAFRGCTRLSSFTIPDHITSIGSNAFRGCNGFTSVTIPDNVISIGDNAFRECGNLMRINIGSGVKNIGSMAFGACPEMSEVFCYATSVPTTAYDAFNQSYAKAATLYVHATFIPDYQSTNPWDKFGTIRSLPDEVFTLTYMVDGSVFKTYRLEYGATITPEAAPTKEGHTFSGWSDIPETMPAHDVTITGSFTVNKYKLTYIVDGAEYKSSEVEYGAAISPETAPVKEGYTFSGWSEIPETMPAHDVTVTGSFTVNKYKLTYIVDDTEYKSFEIEFGAKITPEAEPIKEGYTFSGWSEIPETMPAQDVTVTGSFTVNRYKLTYMVDGAEYKSMEVEYGATITPEAEPVKEGYTFSGWGEIPETMPAHDVTVTGSFTINKYKLTYMVDGAEYKSYEIEFGATIMSEAEPKKEGYTFSGWGEIPETMPAHDVTVTGSFTVNRYKLTYMVDGTEYKSMEVEYGATITPEAEPVKEGYTFSGWGEIPETMPAHDVTVTGSFTVNKYKLTYMVDGAEYKSSEVEYGATITPETEPKKEGYTFSGWGEIPETMPAHDVTVTGSFTVNRYKLTYMVDATEYKSMEVEYGASITPEAEPVKEGYTFSGWSLIPETMPAHDVTVTGSFTVNKYKLTYVVDGAEYKSMEVEYGTTITPEAEPTKEGYTFSGWSLIPETMPAHDVTVTGTFTKGNYKLTYLVDDEIYKVISYDFGDKITPEAAPQKDGHTFSGWSEIPETMPAHDVIVTGSFSVNKYRLTYMVDGAEYKSFEVEYGTKITPESEPTKEGYTFSGWSWIPNKMPAEDVVVTGYFTVNKYTLTYIVDDAEYKSFEIEFGAKILPEAEPMKEGYTFSGWSEIPETMPAHDVTVTGTFTKGNYKLTYMIDDEVYKVISYDFGDKITPEEEPSKEGYTFSGWSEIPETMPAHDVTVTGSFTVNKYKLTYVVNGAEYKSSEVEFGTTIIPEAEPTKEGYTFSGWSEIPETMPAHDVTVTGSFTVNKYKLTYVVDGAEYKSSEVEFGTTITPEEEPMKEGYTFSGWSEIPETMPAHDVTVTGTFVENEKEKTFNVDGIIYAITSENTVTLISGEGAQGDYEIPQTVTFDGVTYTVTAIGDSAFKDNKDITQLTIPDNIEQIGGNAFDGCSRLQTIYIGKGVREIGSKAFANIGTETSGLQVYCYPDVIPVTAIDAFENTPISSATLNVVDELVDIYKATRPWMDFGNISGLSNVGISNVYGDATDVEVFNLQGHKMNHLRKGLNIIRHKNGTTSKVIVR